MAFFILPNVGKAVFRQFFVFPMLGKPIFVVFWFSPVAESRFSSIFDFPPWRKANFRRFLIFPRGGKPPFPVFRSSYPYESLLLPFFYQLYPVSEWFFAKIDDLRPYLSSFSYWAVSDCWFSKRHLCFDTASFLLAEWGQKKFWRSWVWIPTESLLIIHNAEFIIHNKEKQRRLWVIIQQISAWRKFLCALVCFYKVLKLSAITNIFILYGLIFHLFSLDIPTEIACSCMSETILTS